MLSARESFDVVGERELRCRRSESLGERGLVGERASDRCRRPERSERERGQRDLVARFFWKRNKRGESDQMKRGFILFL